MCLLGGMRYSLTFFMLISLSVPALADDKTCILAAAERLPRIAGLQIKESRTRPLPPDIAKRWTAGGKLPVIIDLDYAAAGVTDTATFMCAKAQDGRMLITKVVQ